MNYIELSITELSNQCDEWAKDIKKEYSPELIVFVAKAGYLIGARFSQQFKVPLIGVKTVREGNHIKTIIGPVIKRFPNIVRNFLITLELKSSIHSRNDKREVCLLYDISQLSRQKYKKILIVDDSVDTGASIIAVKNFIQKEFKNSEIKVAGLNVWDKSRQKIKTDFALYKNTIIKAPMSKDSNEYCEFLKLYHENYKEFNSGTVK